MQQIEARYPDTSPATSPLPRGKDRTPDLAVQTSPAAIEGVRRRPSAIEAPTLALALFIHAGWLAVTWWHAVIPLPLLMAAGGLLVAWHGSLQHETIHGHPTPWPRVNAALGAMPLTLWLPYAHYRRTHLAHHRTEALTDPFADPESQYRADRAGLGHAIARSEATLVARLAIGPLLRIGAFLRAEAVRAIRRPRAWSREWLPHLALAVPLLLWLRWVGMPLTTYLVAFVYPGMSLTLLRSFAEHRADPRHASRAAIVERGGLLGLLFLHNNLHAVHHARPDLPWYRLPAHWRAHRARYAAAPLYPSYAAIVRRHAFRAHDTVTHPDYRGARP